MTIGSLTQANGIIAAARSWHAQPANAVQVDNGALVVDGTTYTLPLPPVPSGEDSNLGKAGRSASYSSATRTTIASGPNAGFTYFPAPLSFSTFFFEYIINPDLVDQSSNFSMHQCGANGYIAWSDLLTQTRRHEYNSSMQSHWAFYSTSINKNNPGDYFEASVAIPGQDLTTFDTDVSTGLANLLAKVKTDTAMEPYAVNYSETGMPLGNINYAPYVSCN